MIGAAVVSLVAVVVAGLWVWRQSADSIQATNLRLISTFSGEHWGASFSPDGNFIAFLKEADGVPQVWVKNLAEGDPIQVTFGDVPARRLVWSPLNDRIVFSRFRAGLWSVPPLGGPARRILEFGDAPKFSADGKRLVFTRGTAIWIANADGGDAHEVPGVPKTPWTARSIAGSVTRRTDDRLLSPERVAHLGRYLGHPGGGRPGSPAHVRFVRRRVAKLDAGRTIHRVFFRPRRQPDAVARAGHRRHTSAADDRCGRGYRAGHFSRWKDASLWHAAQELEPDPVRSGDRPGEGGALPSDSNRVARVLSQRRSDRVHSANRRQRASSRRLGGWARRPSSHSWRR